MTKWKQLDTALSTDAGVAELDQVLSELDAEARESLIVGEFRVPPSRALENLYAGSIGCFIGAALKKFLAAPTQENFLELQVCLVALCDAWTAAGYCLGRQHADEIKEPADES